MPEQVFTSVRMSSSDIGFPTLKAGWCHYAQRGSSPLESSVLWKVMLLLRTAQTVIELSFHIN